MSQDISGFGLRVVVTATSTFPIGFTVSAFADDADPFDLPELTIAETGMGLNGDLITWSNANPINITLNVIPNSDDDRNLQALFNSNRVGRGKQSVLDVITLVGIYPDGSRVVLTEGKTTSYIPANSVASAGRIKSKPYSFMMENIVNSL